jgi:4-hydroxythreonine-4-phosphate dehydrogenase
MPLNGGPRPLAVAMGDPAGIGPEIVAKAWDARRDAELPLFVAVGDPASVSAVWNGPIEVVSTPMDAAACFGDALPVIELPAMSAVTPGDPTSRAPAARSIRWNSRLA